MQIEGRNPVLEALRARTPIEKVILEKNIKKDEKISEILELAKKQNINVRFDKKYLLDKKSKTQTHQGVIALGTQKEQQDFNTLITNKNAFLIYIRDALYEHNVGAIIRTAECVGATGVILPPKISVSPQIRRAAMGATEHISITNHNLFQAIKEAQEAGLQVVGIERTGSSTNLYETKLDVPIMLIIGGEDRSLSTQITDKCDKVVEIPMEGNVNSLNMSVAAAVVMYEVRRQNN
ncbi:23S rRNA (guanosine(2251)-2'-O)-methyltransferase RlmB [Candidatus Dojkabacteria bacterium]|nr:23S rRNA (guanosine(2251)-2'-O)-methyltransferase RlmB [Candidatus Dojkabacteria bacterium]